MLALMGILGAATPGDGATPAFVAVITALKAPGRLALTEPLFPLS